MGWLILPGFLVGLVAGLWVSPRFGAWLERRVDGYLRDEIDWAERYHHKSYPKS